MPPIGHAPCALCGGDVVWLPARSANTETWAGESICVYYSDGWTCLGCAPLGAIPEGMVPKNRKGREAAARRRIDAIWARMEARLTPSATVS